MEGVLAAVCFRLAKTRLTREIAKYVIRAAIVPAANSPSPAATTGENKTDMLHLPVENPKLGHSPRKASNISTNSPTTDVDTMTAKS